MFKKILTGLTISLGVGLLLRAGAKRNQGAAALPSDAPDPLLARLDAIEARMFAIEHAAAAEIPAGDCAGIRDIIADLERRNLEQIGALGQRFNELEQHLPRFIDVKVSTRVREMEERIKADIVEARGKTFESVVASIEAKMLAGIAVVERSLTVQSQEIGELKQRLSQTDQNLSKVLATAEKLTESGAFQFSRVSGFAEPAVNGR